MQLIYVLPDGQRQALEVTSGTNAMQAAVDAGLSGIVGECGGSAMCATCHVYVVDGPMDRLPAMGPSEDGMLEATASERRLSSRLSCQIVLTPALDGLVLEMPASQV